MAAGAGTRRANEATRRCRREFRPAATCQTIARWIFSHESNAKYGRGIFKGAGARTRVSLLARSMRNFNFAVTRALCQAWDVFRVIRGKDTSVAPKITENRWKFAVVTLRVRWEKLKRDPNVLSVNFNVQSSRKIEIHKNNRTASLREKTLVFLRLW